MSAIWNWPGSRWWRVDLHAHTPDSHDFGTEQDRSDRDWRRWVEAARDAGLHAVAVTDHNTGGGIPGIQEAARVAAGDLVVFPGVEVTASCGTHLLVLFDPKGGQPEVDDFLSRAGSSVASRGSKIARSPESVERLLKLVNDRPALLIAAHVNGPCGLLAHDGEQRLAELRCGELVAAEVDPGLPLDSKWLDGSLREVGRPIPILWGSDAHRFEELGRRFTWVKMTRPDLEGLRLALLDGDESSLRQARRDEPGDPNIHAALVVESIRVQKARYLGWPAPFELRFNPWMNSIIGGRGTGKSTLVDFLRKTLRREAELDGVSLREVFDARLSVPGSDKAEGLLTAETTLEVVYRRDGERFLISWDAAGSASPIRRLTEGGDTVEHGEVRERFPVRIYSQKQLFELAQTPNALLGVVDESQPVRGPEFRRQLEAVAGRYLALRAEARATRARSDALPDRRAALADIKRKLEVLQTGGSAQALAAFRLRRQQDSTWRSILHAVESGIEAVAAASEALVVSDLGPAGADAADPGSQALSRMHCRLGTLVDTLRARLEAAMEEARGEIQGLGQGPESGEWAATVAASEDGYRAAAEVLAGSGIASPDEYRELMDRAAALEAEIQALVREEQRSRELEAQAEGELRAHRQLRQDWTKRRQDFARSASGDLLQVEIKAHGVRDQEVLVTSLRDILRIERFDGDFQHLAARLAADLEAPWPWEVRDGLVADLRRVQGQPDATVPPLGGRFLSALRRLDPEQFDRLALYSPEDSLEVRFRDPRQPAGRFKPLAQGSPGQQTAALLAFVLGYGNEPIVLDQPEDDLDNTLIYDLVVQRLRETKTSRQVIVVTHNPNIVVHGDAELVVSLEAVVSQTLVKCHGGLQEGAVRDEICRVMEGGREAFETRFRRIVSDRRLQG